MIARLDYTFFDSSGESEEKAIYADNWNHFFTSSDAEALEIVNFAGGSANPSYTKGSPIYHSASLGDGSIAANAYSGAQVDALGNPSPVTDSGSWDFSQVVSDLTDAQPAEPQLLNLFITPQNQIYDGAGVSVGPHTEESFPYFVTAVYSDGTYADMTGAAQWSVQTQGATGTGAASFDSTAGEVILKVPASVGNADLLIQVTDPVSGMQVSTMAQTAY